MNARKHLDRVGLLGPLRKTRRFVRHTSRNARTATHAAAETVSRGSRPARRAGRDVAARVPMLRGVHTSTRAALLRRRVVRVPIDMLLLGGENRMNAKEYAAAVHRPLRPSTRLVDGPHVALLQAARACPDRVFSDDELRATAYVENALDCIAATGSYFAATTDIEAVQAARDFLGWANGGDVEPALGAARSESRCGSAGSGIPTATRSSTVTTARRSPR